MPVFSSAEILSVQLSRMARLSKLSTAFPVAFQVPANEREGLGVTLTSGLGTSGFGLDLGVASRFGLGIGVASGPFVGGGVGLS